jgi:hypothetical protein
MLKIKLSPVRSDSESLTASWIAPVLTVNGEAYDLSELPDGATAVHEILGKVSRVINDYEVTLTLPHGPNAPHETRFPEDIIVDTDGEINLPIYGE